MNHPDAVTGDHSGVPFPTTIEPLLERGTQFLTAALQATGVLAQDNQVSAIVHHKEFFGGGMGRKLLLSIEYQRDVGLKKELFVKLPRMFGDPLRDLFAPLMEPEVRFALLSRRDDFPIAVPECYFADYNRATATGILITERIPYGQGAIEPCHDKCLDYTLSEPLGHYRALTKALARLAGFHKAGRFGPTLEQQFPFDPHSVDAGARIPYTPEQLQAKLEKLRSFAAAHPGLLPGAAGSPQFLERLSREVPLVLQHELAIRRHLNQHSELIALCHWNANLDNAWFWSDAGAELQAGLLDWGSVAQMNLAQGFYGMTCAAETEFLNVHRRALMELFLEEYRASGGPHIAIEQFAFLFKLAVAVLGVAWILDAPALVQAQIPQLHRVKDRYDPRLRNDFLARAQLQLLVVFLNEWQVEDVGSALREFAARYG
jgi:hypothetical protein